MKAILLILPLLISLQAQAGSISCVTENGEVITAQLDGEAQITELTINDVGNKISTSDLEADSVDLTNNQMTLRFSGFWDAETPFKREIKVAALNVLTHATYGEFDVQAPSVDAAQCIVLFTAAE